MEIKWIECYLIWYDGEKDSFCSRGLNKPGTLVELKHNLRRIAQRELIGSINTEGGVCDYSTSFDYATIILRYAVLLSCDELDVSDS